MTWRGRRRATGPPRRRERGLSQRRRAPDLPTFTDRYPEWVWQYYVTTGDSITLAGLHPTLVRLSDFLDGHIDSSTGLVTGLAMTSEVTTSTVTTSTRSSTRRSTSWRWTPSTGSEMSPSCSVTAPTARPVGPRAGASPPPSTPTWSGRRALRRRVGPRRPPEHALRHNWPTCPLSRTGSPPRRG